MMRYFISGKETTIAQALNHLGEHNFYKKVKEAYDFMEKDRQCAAFAWPAEHFEIRREVRS